MSVWKPQRRHSSAGLACTGAISDGKGGHPRRCAAFDILRTMGNNDRTLWGISWKRAKTVAVGCVGAATWLLSACSPATQGTDGTPPDLAGVERDMTPICTEVVGNLLGNPGFEASIGGTASNLGGSASSIPNWQGCCGTMQTTTYEVTSTQRYCGERSVRVTGSSEAMMNVLFQGLTRPGDAGKTFVLSGWVNVTSITGGEISLDVFNLNSTPASIVAPTVSLKNVSSGWFELRATGTMPTGGNVQIRINTSGNIEAFVDNLSLRIP